MKHVFFLFIFLLPQPAIFAQTLSGRVLDKKTNTPVPYVNIGIVGKGIGTVSDMEGYFKMNMHDSLNSQTIRFSCIGYKPITFSVSDFKKRFTDGAKILLEENIVSLNQVVVKPKVFKTKVLGNENNSRMIAAGFFSNDLGSELGVVMHIKRSPTFIENVKINLASNTAGTAKFRLNIYNIKNGEPDSIILKEPIFVTTDLKFGTVTIDLAKYNLYVEHDFLVSIEWIEDYGDKSLYFCSGMMNSNCLYRKTSQDAWHNAKPVGIGINCKVTYEK